MRIALFFSGFAMASFAASALIFLKLWRTSGDRFFLWFALAFGLLSLERVALLAVGADHMNLWTPAVEASAWVYLIRMSAFAAIGLAMIGKNRGDGRRV